MVEETHKFFTEMIDEGIPHDIVLYITIIQDFFLYFWALGTS